MADTIPVFVSAREDKSATNKVARSFDNLSRPRDVVLAATLDARSIASATKPLGAIRRSADEFEKSMAAANARVLAFGTSVAVIEGMRRSLLALVKTTASVENALTQISVVAKDELDAAGVSINQIGQQIFETARKTGQSVDSVSKTFLEFSRQGLKPVQTLERTKTALDLVRISGAEQEKVISGLTAAYNSFSSTGITFTQIAEKLVNVDNKTTTSVEGLVDVLARASSTAKLTGTSLEELLAITATLKDVTARSESVIGNAYRSISARLIDPEILKNLEELGVKTREFDGGPLLKTIGILTNVASKLKEIADPSLKTEIVKSISGLYQFDQLSALITALEDVNNLQGFYQKNLSASTEKSKALENASKAFSEILVNKFNAVDVTIQQVLNSIGQLGIKDPLSSLLDNITEIGNGLTSLIDGEGAGSSLAQFFIKGFSSIVLGPTGIVTIGFAISKIIFDFGKFAVEAGRSFLSLNKTAKDQELIQKSILTTISQMPSIMTGIENTEQGRLLLAQRISLLYEKTLRDATLLSQVTSGAAPKVYSQGFRIGESGLKKVQAAKGYLPDLVNKELSDVRKGVGGASPDSKVVVMPNFPFGGGKKGLMVANSSETILKTGSGYGILNKDMMGQSAASGFNFQGPLKNKSGQFVEFKPLEDAIKLMAKGWLSVGKEGLELSNLIKKQIGFFQLENKFTGSFSRASKAANEYVNSLIRDRKALGSNLPAPSFALLPSFLQSQIDPAILKGLTSQRKANTPKLPEELFNVELGRAEAERRNKLSRGEFYKAKNEERLQQQAALKNRLLGNYGDEYKSIRESRQGSFLSFSRNEPIAEEANKKAQSSLESFATKAFIASAAVDFIAGQFRGQSEQLDKFAKAASNATIALIGFQFLNRSSGITAGSLLEKAGGLGGIGGKVGGGFSKIAPAISSFAGGISAAAKGLARFLPIIGQFSLAAFAVNEFSKVFFDKSLYQQAKEALTGVTEAGERAKEKFNEIAGELFDPKGKFVGRTEEGIRSNLDEARVDIQARSRAKKLGIDTEGKKTPEILDEEIKALIQKSLELTKTGTTTTFNFGSFAGGGSNTIEDNLANFNRDASAIIASSLKDTLPSPEKMKEIVSRAGNKSFDKENLTENEISELILEYNKIVLAEFVKSQKDSFAKGKASLDPLAFQSGLVDFFENFTIAPKLDPKSLAKENDFVGPNIPKEVLNNLSKFQSELNLLILDGTISSLESQIKSLEFKASGNVSSLDRNRLLNKADKITAEVYNKRLEKLEKEQKIEIDNVNPEGKVQSEINAEIDVIKQKYKNQVQELGNSISATRNETKARNDSFRNFQKLNPIISNLERSLSRSAVGRAQTEAELALIQAQASNPALGARSQEGFQRQSAAKELKLLQRDLSEAKTIKKRDLNNAELSIEDPDKLKEEKNKINKAFSAQEKSINGQIAALNETTNQIGVTKSSFIALDDAIFQFTQTLGESRGQNQFNLLQATDPNSIVQGLIGEQVYNSAGIGSNITEEQRRAAQVATTIAQQNALLNEQFKIKTAASETERLELQRSYDLTNELIQIRNSGLDPIREQAALEKAINDNLEKRRTFGAGVEDSTAGMRDRIQSFNADFGRTATDGFKDALSGAIKAAVSETTNLKDALLDVALQFANSLRDKAIDNLADVFTNSLFGKGGSSGGSSGNIVSSLVGAVGGLFKGYASGGQVTGGTGTKDDVPTLLMGGEYVIPKNVVQSYGKGFFDRLRDGSIGKMAQGGYFAPGVRGQGTISGKENLLDFATQTATSGKGDIISSLGVNAGLVSLEPESLRLSNFARFGDSPILQASQETKEQAFGLYLDQLSAEKEYQKYLDDLKKAKKEKTKQFWISLAVAAVGAGVGAYANGAGAGAGAGAKAGTAAKAATSTAGQSSGSFTSGLIKSIGGFFTNSRNTNSNNGINSQASIPRQLPNGIVTTKSDGFYNPYPTSSSVSRSFSNGFPIYEPSLPIGVNGRAVRTGNINPLLPRLNSGGAVSGNGDTIPAMLSNKEFVLNSSAAQKIGYKDLYAMNSGANPSGGESETRIVAKLDELIEKTIGASNISVNVSMTNSGENNQQDNSQQSDSNASERQRFLTQRLKDTVISVLREEQRPGGLLTSTRR